MAATTEELLQMILQSLEKVEYIKSEDIPNIDLYMDQVLTFMDRKLRSAVRPQTEDRILTKTMINNYAKNDLRLQGSGGAGEGTAGGSEKGCCGEIPQSRGFLYRSDRRRAGVFTEICPDLPVEL